MRADCVNLEGGNRRGGGNRSTCQTRLAVINHREADAAAAESVMHVWRKSLEESLELPATRFAAL